MSDKKLEVVARGGRGGRGGRDDNPTLKSLEEEVRRLKIGQNAIRRELRTFEGAVIASVTDDTRRKMVEAVRDGTANAIGSKVGKELAAARKERIAADRAQKALA